MTKIQVAPAQNKITPMEMESSSNQKDKTVTIESKGKAKETKESVPIFSLWRFAAPYEKFLVFIACLLSAGIGALQPVAIIITGDVLNGGAATDTFTLSKDQVGEALRDSGVDLLAMMQPTILKFVYFGIAILFGAYFSQALWVFTSDRLTRKIRERYVQAILRQDVGWHDMAEEGSLTTRLSLDVQLIQEGVGEKFGSVLQSFASFVGGLAVAFSKGWKLSLVIIACLPILIIVGVFLGIQIKNFITKTQNVYADAGAIAEQAFGGIRTVYAFSLQNRFVKKYDDKLKNAEYIDAKKGTVFGVGFGVFMFVLYSILGLGFWYGSTLVIKDEMPGGNVMVVFFAMLIGSMSLMGIPSGLQAVTTAQGAAFKVYNVIERVPVIDTSNTGGIKKEKLDGYIEFQNVAFHYPTRPNVPILKGLSLSIKPGQTVAFVGPSGSGKSTSVSLVQRFYDAVAGTVLIDGQDIKQYNLLSLRQHIGLVGQEPVLFNMTIRENILMGTTEPITQTRLIEVCEMANCHKFISMLPNGYDTQVGEHGGMLSGGQKQRIAIARALIKDPQVLLLDEATSALDTASERIVQKALDVAAKNRTTIVIAHRLSTIRDADLICVMDKGDLVEQGTHNELIALNGVYTQLVEKQKIAQKEKAKEPEPGDKDDKEEVEVFNVPNQASLLKKSASIAATDALVVNIADEAGALFMPDAAAMTRIANAKRVQEKNTLKSRQKELPKFSYRRVVGFLSGYYHLLASGVFGAIIAGGVQPVFAFLLAKVIVTLLNPDKSQISPGALEGANLYAFLFVILGVGAFFGIALQLTSLERTSSILTRKLRRMTFNSLLKQEVGFYDMPGHSLGALTSRLATDASHVCSMVGTSWGELAQFVSTIITGLVIALIQSPALTGIILAVSPPLIYASYYQATMMAGFEDKTRKAYEEASEIAAEAIKEIRTVEALTRESWFRDRYSASLDHPQRLGYLKAFRDSIGFAFNAGAGQFMSALGFHMGMKFMIEGKIGFENLFICLMTVMITAQSVGRSSTFMSNLKKGKLAAINTFEFIDRVTAIDPDQDGYVPPEGEFDPNFSFQNISFSYPARPNQPIFTGEFSVSGRKNQTLALVGPSGCGKSTTIGMLERWYDATGGTVSVGANEVKSYQLKRGLRKHMALVGQEPVLFDMSIRENILWGMDEEEMENNDLEEKMQQAATLANIHGFVSSLPDGYNTRVGDKGSQLSGGQKQRIAIARALIRNPKILLLDEATSALDSESEKIVQEAIDRASAGRTTVTIAHRLSTIQNADQIAVVNGGKIVELGRHFELLELNGLYADLVRQQDLSAHT